MQRACSPGLSPARQGVGLQCWFPLAGIAAHQLPPPLLAREWREIDRLRARRQAVLRSVKPPRLRFGPGQDLPGELAGPIATEGE